MFFMFEGQIKRLKMAIAAIRALSVNPLPADHDYSFNLFY